MSQINAQDIKTELDTINLAVKNAIASTNEEVQKHGKIGEKNSQALDGLTNQLQEATARILELEQHGTSQQDIENHIKSVGAEFTDSDAFGQFTAGNTTKATLEVQNNIVVGSDATVAPDRRPGVVGGAIRRFTVMDAIPQGTTSSNSIEYTRELVFTNDAAETQEGNFAMPESDITFELVVAPVRNIGHFIYVSKQMLEDAPTIASYIDGRLRYGVEFRKDLQAMVGNGTGQNLSGLFASGNYTALTGASSGDNQYTNIRRAIAQVAAADYMADVIFLNPVDCAAIDLIEATDGQFVGANPRIQNIKTLWGLPVVETNAMTAGKFLVGALGIAAQFSSRRNTIVEVSDSHNDNFTKDMATIKATARAALEIYRPASLVGGDLVTP